MLLLSKPATQDRLNAAVFEVIGLNVMGSVGIPGRWDAEKAIQYIEKRLKESITQQMFSEEGTQFYAKNKVIHFSPTGVLIEPVQTIITP
jgi:hypothetical protein